MNLPHSTETGRVIVVHPFLRDEGYKAGERLQEATGLAAAINLEVVQAETVRLRQIRPATLLGQGSVELLGSLVQSLETQLVYVDASLSPIQQRNLEKAWQCKVIDRTGLILEIFGARARTAEGRLQVELAALTYQRSRLVRSWTHLERQRGGLGFIGGPGESQLEMDKRLITERITKIRRELETVKRTRQLHRTARQRVPYPIVALVGYTNAGKSTLFNKLTASSVMAEDLLFATLDPTMRSLRLPSGKSIILSDTVGFISALPTQLIAAFQATLEEVLEADLIIHVRDISHSQTDEQAQEVYKILEELGLKSVIDNGMIEVLNKVDLLADPEIMQHRVSINHIKASALTGQGLEDVLQRIEECLSIHHVTHSFFIPAIEGAAIAWLHAHGKVIQQTEDPEDPSSLTLSVKLSYADLQKFHARFPAFTAHLSSQALPVHLTESKINA